MADSQIHACQRIAPKEGYRFGNKAQYRRTIWANFRRKLRGQTAQAHAALMPSIEGLEIEVAKQNGFRECHLHVIDSNPAIVATLKRKYPYINTYGVDVRKAIDRIRERGVRLSCANWDFCGPAVSALGQDLMSTCSDPAIYTPENLIAFTAMKGRDDPNWLAVVEGAWKSQVAWDPSILHCRTGQIAMTARTHFMITTALHCKDRAERHSEMPGGFYIGEYKSSAGTPMVFVIIHRHRRPCPCAACTDLETLPFYRASDHRDDILHHTAQYRTKRGAVPRLVELLQQGVPLQQIRM